MQQDAVVVYVRLLTQEDLPAYIKMFSPRVRAILRASCYWYEYDYVYTQVQKQGSKTFFYGVFVKQPEVNTDALIGAIEIRGPEYRGQLYTWLHEQWWGKGIFQKSFKQVCQDYFKRKPKETLITATVDVSNARSYQALSKAGFSTKGRIPGPYEDQYEMVFLLLRATA